MSNRQLSVAELNEVSDALKPMMENVAESAARKVLDGVEPRIGAVEQGLATNNRKFAIVTMVAGFIGSAVTMALQWAFGEWTGKK